MNFTAGEIVIIIAAIGSAVVSIVNAVQLKSVSKTQEIEKANAVSRDNRIQDIHVLVNSGRTVLLRAAVELTKEKADRTKDPKDIKKYEEYFKQLDEVEKATVIVEENRKAENLLAEAKAKEAV